MMKDAKKVHKCIIDVVFAFCFFLINVNYALPNGKNEVSDRRRKKNDVCLAVSGPFVSRTIASHECKSIVDICTVGELYGTIRARYEMVANQLLSTGETTIPQIKFFTAKSLIEIYENKKVMVGIDTGSINLESKDSIESGRLSSMLTFISGASGYLFISGRLNLRKGIIRGRYSGKICPPINCN